MSATRTIPLIRVKDFFSGSANVTKNYTDAMNCFLIANDGAAPLTFTIGSLTITVNSGEVFEDYFAPFKSVTVTTTVSFRAWVKGE